MHQLRLAVPVLSLVYCSVLACSSSNDVPNGADGAGGSSLGEAGFGDVGAAGYGAGAGGYAGPGGSGSGAGGYVAPGGGGSSFGAGGANGSGAADSGASDGGPPAGGTADGGTADGGEGDSSAGGAGAGGSSVGAGGGAAGGAGGTGSGAGGAGGSGVGGSSAGGSSAGGSGAGGSGAGGSGAGGSGAGGSGAGGSGAGGSGAGGSGAGGGGMGGNSGYVPPCITDPASEAFILGDSYVTGFASPALQPSLAAIIPSIGQYGNYAGAGCSMASGGVCTGLYGNVPQQFQTAIAAHPNAKFVIMDGGGNDILICDTVKYPGCNTLCAAAGSSTQKVCTDIVQAAIDTANNLLVSSAAAGIRDVIYFFYPHIPAKNGGYKEILDYAEPLAKAACDGAEAKTNGKMRCHFVDLVKPFASAFGDAAPSQFEAVLQVHPLQPGVDLMAKTITDVMKNECLGQASGCCAP
jgi:hypothetical protein